MNQFLKNAQSGKNQWWRYVLVPIAVVVVIIIANQVVRLLLPQIKTLFPDTTFGKDLGILILIFLIFGMALLTFIVAFQKIHQRKVFSLINLEQKFHWLLYIQGFLVWGTLLFVSALITNYEDFSNFLKHFNLSNFLILAFVSLISIGVQSFFEEIVIRAYWLQGKSLKIKNTILLIVLNGFIFGILHLGYSLDSFIGTWFFGIAFAIIILKQKRIEFVSGAHSANNIVLSLLFLDLSEALQRNFTWSVDWLSLFFEIFVISLLVVWVHFTTKTKKE